MLDSVEEIEKRRLGILERQAALHGPQTDPSILIEIAELKHKQRDTSNPERKAFVNALDYDFLMSVIAKTLVRVNELAEGVVRDTAGRSRRQLIHDVWMIAITVISLVTLILQLRGL